MKKNLRLYGKLFLSTFILSAFTFGGGYVIVPLMQKRFVKEYKWIDEEEMLDLVAIGQSAPGPIAVNASILVGYRMAGIPGALITVLGTVLPPLITIAVISYFYMEFRDNRIVRALLKGMQVGVAAVIVDVVAEMAAKVIKSRATQPITIMLLAFTASSILDASSTIILPVCGALGAIAAKRAESNKNDHGTEAEKK